MSEDGGGCCALAERHDRDQRGVAARISGLVAASTHDVRERVDEERGMPEHHGRQEESDDESAPPGEQERHGSEHPWADPVVSVQEPQLREPGGVTNPVDVGTAVAVGQIQPSGCARTPSTASGRLVRCRRDGGGHGDDSPTTMGPSAVRSCHRRRGGTVRLDWCGSSGEQSSGGNPR